MVSRDEAYQYLSSYLGLPPEKCHMNRFNADQCEETAEWAKQIIQDFQDLDR